MQLSAILDLLIGMSFMFFLLSLIASGIQEIIAGFFTWRGTYLSKGLDVILDNKPDARFVFAGVLDWLKAHFTSSAGRTVAEQYRIDVQKTPAMANGALAQVLDVQKHPLLRSNPTTLPSYVSARNFGLAMLAVLRDGSQSPLFTQVEKTVSALPPGDLKTTLTLFVQDAGGDLDKFRSSLEHWFDDAMDRVSGAYKRLSQYALLIIGLLLAIVLNVSTFRVVEKLWASPDLRSAIVTEASKATMSTAVVANANTTPTDDQVRQQVKEISQRVQDFETAQFPIGWSCWYPEPSSSGHSSGSCIPTPPNEPWSSYLLALANYAVLSAIGWSVTAIAISLGSPFWFDLVQNFVNLRNAGAKPNRSDDPRPPGANA